MSSARCSTCGWTYADHYGVDCPQSTRTALDLDRLAGGAS